MNTTKRILVLPAMLALISLTLTSCSTSRASCPSNQVALAGNRGSTNELPICLVVDLVDGSRLVGVPGIASIPMQTAYAKLDIALKHVRSITLEPDRELAVFQMRNGDRVKGAMILKTLVLQTAFGKVSVCLEQISRVASTIYGSGIATGGTITNYTLDGINYQAHIFTNVGTTNFIVTGGALDCDVLVVAGGGGGGSWSAQSQKYCGGGGGGGVIVTNLDLTGTTSVQVGAGGACQAANVGINGSNTVFGGLTAYGGGAGGSGTATIDGNNGGSGGGDGALGGRTGVGATGVSEQGNNAGTSNPGSPYQAGGGGGASSAGGYMTGNSGDGIASDLSGNSSYYAGGGAGSGDANGSAGSGGTAAKTSAVSNTGAGGGGGAGVGGSGIVIVRYAQ